MQNSVVKKILQQTLFEMMAKRKIDKITVQEIITRCGISRATFYRVYHDKFDLMNDCYRTAVDELNTMFEGDSREKVIEGIYAFLNSRKGFFCNALKMNGADSLTHFLYEHTYQFYERQLKQRKGSEQLSTEALDCIAFYCAGAVHLCELWINRGMKETPQKMAQEIFRCMPADLREYFCS